MYNSDLLTEPRLGHFHADHTSRMFWMDDRSHIYYDNWSRPWWSRGNVLAGSNPADVDGFFQDVKILREGL